MSFADLGLSEEVLKAVSDAGYSDPTPIQKGAIPNVLMGRDILGLRSNRDRVKPLPLPYR